MTHYRVFLPPPDLSYFPAQHSKGTPSSGEATTLLKLHDLEMTSSLQTNESFSLPLVRERGRLEGERTWVMQGSAVESLEKSTILGKRGLLDDPLHIANEGGKKGNADQDEQSHETRGMVDEGLGVNGKVNGDAVRGLEPGSEVTDLSDSGQAMVVEDTSRRRSRRITRQSGEMSLPSLLKTVLDLKVQSPADLTISPCYFSLLRLPSVTSHLFTLSSASLLDAALPHFDPSPAYSESSLNTTTTTSYPSQLPPSQFDGGGDTSVSHFPRWHIPLTRLTTLHSLLSHPAESARSTLRRGRRVDDVPGKELHTLIICVLGVDQPVLRKRKEERARRGEGSLWIGKWTMIAPPSSATRGAASEGNVDRGGGGGEVTCPVKLWDECARDWGDEKVRRGDVVLVENIEFKPATSKEPFHLVLTPHNTPKMTILFRTLPRCTTPATTSDYIYKPRLGGVQQHGQGKGKIWPEDAALRPDLRLGRSDAGVRKVAEVVRWFAEWVGGEGAG
nr:uncharacterized protein CI109_000640 [Kwoniella shandongensis]KAA5531068.1 hypothetical protein CI109_000640 [Kwoniella shandongensis]